MRPDHRNERLLQYPKPPNRAASSSSARRALIAGLVTFGVGLPIVVVLYLTLGQQGASLGPPLGPPEEAGEQGPEFIGKVAHQSQAEGLEQVRSMMSEEEFERTFGPAIRHERENPEVVIGSSADIDRLPDNVGSVVAPTITDAGLARLAQRSAIRELDLRGNKNLTDAGMKHVASIRGLESLNVGETAVGDDGIALLAGCNLTYFGGWYTKVGDRGVGVLAAMPAMKQLQLKGCSNITDNGIAKLAPMRNLWMLHISKCPAITDKSIPVLAGVQSLTFIQAFDSGITDAGERDYLAKRPNAKFDR